jgi:hypothetical protein
MNNQFTRTTWKSKRARAWWREKEFDKKGKLVSNGSFNFNHYKKIMNERGIQI